MNTIHDPKEQDRVLQARTSFSGQKLTDSQFDEAMAITGIIEREIRKTGTFKEKLGDYSYAFSRSEKFDAMRGETIIRDLFKERFGQTMNRMREGLIQREAGLGQSEKTQAMCHALNVGTMIAEGETMPFYRAYDHQAVQLSRSLDITETGAKKLMKEEYRSQEGQELYDYCKSVEEQYHRPKVEAEKKQREAGRAQTRSRQRA